MTHGARRKPITAHFSCRISHIHFGRRKVVFYFNQDEENAEYCLHPPEIGFVPSEFPPAAFPLRGSCHPG
jgi:hypothetical protein